MIVTLIVVCEVGFWVLLAAGLAVRYLLKMPRTGLALLLCEPLLEVLLLVVTAVDLKNGAEPDWRHGLAALYIGYTVGHGHRTVKWLDGHAAHRLGGARRPSGRRGTAWPAPATRGGLARSVTAAAVASGLLLLAARYVGDDGDTEPAELDPRRLAGGRHPRPDRAQLRDLAEEGPGEGLGEGPGEGPREGLSGPRPGPRARPRPPCWPCARG